MKNIILKRIHTGEFGTFGVLMEKDRPPFALTLEPPWKDNEPNISCIPAMTYHVFPVVSPRFGKTWEVVDVPGRSHILFHKGNIAKPSVSDTLGCILVGERFEFLGGHPAILASKPGFNEFMDILDEENVFKLSIMEHY